MLSTVPVGVKFPAFNPPFSVTSYDITLGLQVLSWLITISFGSTVKRKFREYSYTMSHFTPFFTHLFKECLQFFFKKTGFFLALVIKYCHKNTHCKMTLRQLEAEPRLKKFVFELFMFYFSKQRSVKCGAQVPASKPKIELFTFCFSRRRLSGKSRISLNIAFPRLITDDVL